jgi:hypothetical protein
VGRELAVDRLLAAVLYRSADYRPFLALVMGDRGARELYAAQVSGAALLADRKRELLGAIARHLFLGKRRIAELEASA